jgi:hypothetical protein
VSQKVVDALVGMSGFYSASLDAELLREEKNKTYVCGTRGRIEWLEQLRKNSRKGGAVRSANTRKAKLKQLGTEEPNGYLEGSLERSQKDSQTEARSKPDLSPLTLAPAPALAPTLILNTNTSIQRRKKKSKNSYPEEFEEIYQSYPKREGKSQGFRVYEKEISSLDDLQQLTAAISNYRRAKSGTEHKYLLHFKTFMNQWRDWLEVPSLPNGALPLRERTVEDILGVSP